MMWSSVMAVWRICPVLCCLFLPSVVVADPIPEPIIRIIAQAAKTEKSVTPQTTIDLAKAANPQSIAEIDTLVVRLRADAEVARVARLSS
jgi:hypothetical protein